MFDFDDDEDEGCDECGYFNCRCLGDAQAGRDAYPDRDCGDGGLDFVVNPYCSERDCLFCGDPVAGAFGARPRPHGRCRASDRRRFAIDPWRPGGSRKQRRNTIQRRRRARCPECKRRQLACNCIPF